MRVKYFVIFILFFSSCNKDVINKANSGTKVKQFHKMVLIDNANNNTFVTSEFGFVNKDGNPNFLYNDYLAPLATNLFWICFGANAQPKFKKRLYIPQDNHYLWVQNVIRNKSGDNIFVGAWLNGLNNMGSGFIVKTDDQANIKMGKVITYNTANIEEQQSLGFASVFLANDGGYFCMNMNPVNHIYPLNSRNFIIKMSPDGTVEWTADLSTILSNETFDLLETSKLIQDNDGNIIVVMRSLGGLDPLTPEYIMKLDKNGDLLLGKKYYFVNGPFTVVNPKYLFVGSENQIYAFEEYGNDKLLINNVRGFEIDANGSTIRSFAISGDCYHLLDVHFQDGAFDLLCGTRLSTGCQYLKLSDKFVLLKQGDIFQGENFPGLSGKAFSGLNGQYTDFILYGVPLNSQPALQYVRLDNNWKYPFKDYSLPAIQIETIPFEDRPLVIDPSQVKKFDPKLFATSEQQFAFQDYSVDKMTVTDISN